MGFARKDVEATKRCEKKFVRYIYLENIDYLQYEKGHSFIHCFIDKTRDYRYNENQQRGVLKIR